jgi:hypothetical protein
MVRYAFRSGKSGLDLSYAENISSMAVGDLEACEPFLPPSPNLARAGGASLSLTFSLTMSSAGRIFAARLREPTRHHVQVAFTFGLARPAFPA